MSMQLNVPAQSLTREQEIDRWKVPAPNTAPQAVCAGEHIGYEVWPRRPPSCRFIHRVSNTLATDVLVWHDMMALCDPVIILCRLIPVTLAAWSLSFSSLACIIVVEWMVILLTEHRVVTHYSVLFRLNG